MSLLKVKNVSKRFGGVVALSNVSLELEEGKIYGLIGPNGSGKTTLFNVITGYYKPDAGSITYKDLLLNGLKPHEIAKMGIGRTFQIPRPLKRLTVLQNMVAAAPKWSDEFQKKAWELLELLDLKQLADFPAGSLSYGEKKQLDMARVLMSDPQLLLMDEPTSGLTSQMITKMLEYIKLIKKQNRSIFIIEHNMGVIMRICDKIFVLDHGEMISEGRPEEIQSDERVVKVYLG